MGSWGSPAIGTVKISDRAECAQVPTVFPLDENGVPWTHFAVGLSIGALIFPPHGVDPYYAFGNRRSVYVPSRGTDRDALKARAVSQDVRSKLEGHPFRSVWNPPRDRTLLFAKVSPVTDPPEQVTGNRCSRVASE